MKIDYAERARALVGTPFRLQGRGRGGLDCIGVVLQTFGLSPDSFRRNYRMRGDYEAELRSSIGLHFRFVPSTQLRPGDLMLMRVASDQLHLAVRTPDGFVHAHAGLRRVVEAPGMPEWPVVSIFRRRSA